MVERFQKIDAAIVVSNAKTEIKTAYTTELVDSLDVKKKAEALKEKRNTLLTELDTQIKVSNATTFVEID